MTCLFFLFSSVTVLMLLRLQLTLALDSWTCEESWEMIFIISSSPLNNFVAKFSNYFQVSAIVWSQGFKQIWKKQGWSEWHKMNYQLKSPPSLAQIVHICYLPAGRSVWWKTVTEVLKILPEAVGRGQHFQDWGHSFSPYGPTLSR